MIVVRKFAMALFALCISAGNGFAQRQSVFDITQFGAVEGGNILCTGFIQRAVNACAANGGGMVLVPPGVFKTGTVFLKSHVELHLAQGAVLKGSDKLDDYTGYTAAGYGNFHYGIIYADSAEDITISGSGVIDGNNAVFFEWDKPKSIEWGGALFTRQKEQFRKVKEGVGDGPVVPRERPRQMLVFSRCKNITVKDAGLHNAPFWTLHFADCDGVRVNGIRLYTGMLVPNADGIDITSCSNVIVSDCDIRAGDDAIAITGYAYHFEIPGYHNLRHISENIVINNCNLRSNSSAIRIGFLDQNTVRNVQVSNINITHSNRGVGLFVRDQGSLENISFTNIYIHTALRTGDWWGNGEPIHISAVSGNDTVQKGQIRQVRFSNIVCKGENGILLYGSKESVLQDISFQHLRFELTDSKLNEIAGGNVDLRGCSLPQQLFERDIPGILAQYVNGLTLEDVQLNWSGTRMPYFTHGLELRHFTNVRIRNFEGNASPVNKKAYRIYAADGSKLQLDNRRASLLQHVQ